MDPTNLLKNSRISPSGSGDPGGNKSPTPPTSGQKWWAAILLGIIYALLANPAWYYLLNKGSKSIGGSVLVRGDGPNVAGLLVSMIVFILIVRLILW